MLAVSAYVRETGDLGILDEPVPYDNAPGSERPLHDHLERALDYTLERLGPHGLPLIGRADWNDCLNLNCFSDTPGESFQTTAEPGRRRGRVGVHRRAVRARRRRAGRARRPPGRRRGGRAPPPRPRRPWSHPWTPTAGTATGSGVPTTTSASRSARPRTTRARSSSSRRASASWPASGSLTDGRPAALAAVRDRLATPHGIVLHQPAFTGYQPRLGEITTYPPGYKENAGIFCHNNPWLMIAEVLAGNPDRALDYYLRINPSAREAISEVHRCEPYVYAQMIAGRDAPTHGEAKNSWLTGTAAWNYVAATQWLLGIRPELDGLRIDPRLPAAGCGPPGDPTVPRRHLPASSVHRECGSGCRVGPRDPPGRRWNADRREPGAVAVGPGRGDRGPRLPRAPRRSRRDDLGHRPRRPRSGR